MKSLWSQVLALCFGLVLLAGCSTDLHLSGVSISIIDFKPKSATLLETQAAMTLRFTNENVVPIAFKGGTFKLYLNDSYVGKSVSHEPLGLPSLNTATQTVTVYLENLALIQKALTIDQKSVFSYRLESVMPVEAGEAHDTMKVVSTGQIDLSAFAQAR